MPTAYDVFTSSSVIILLTLGLEAGSTIRSSDSLCCCCSSMLACPASALWYRKMMRRKIPWNRKSEKTKKLGTSIFCSRRYQGMLGGLLNWSWLLLWGWTNRNKTCSLNSKQANMRWNRSALRTKLHTCKGHKILVNLQKEHDQASQQKPLLS